MKTTVKRTALTTAPVDAVSSEIFEVECQLYAMRRDMTVLKRQLRDLKKARTLLKRSMPAPTPSTPEVTEVW